MSQTLYNRTLLYRKGDDVWSSVIFSFKIFIFGFFYLSFSVLSFSTMFLNLWYKNAVFTFYLVQQFHQQDLSVSKSLSFVTICRGFGQRYCASVLYYLLLFCQNQSTLPFLMHCVLQQYIYSDCMFYIVNLPTL